MILGREASNALLIYAASHTPDIVTEDNKDHEDIVTNDIFDRDAFDHPVVGALSVLHTHLKIKAER